MKKTILKPFPSIFITAFLITSIGLNSAHATDTTAPLKTAASTNVAGTKVVITYDETLAAITPLVGDYDVQVNSASNVVTAVAVSGTDVELTLTTPIVNTDVVTVAYTQSTGAEIQDAAANLSINFAAFAVTNNVPASTPAPAPEPVYIPKTPQVALVLSSSATTVEWGTQAKLTLTGGSGSGVITYSSTGTTFCAIDRNGSLTPVSAGTCTVTVNKDGDETYSSAQSNSIVITATNAPVSSTSSGSNTEVSLVVGKPVGGVATVKFTVADTYAGEKVSIILATKSSTGKTLYKTLGSATVSSTGAVTFKTKVKLPAGGVLQLKSAGTVILSKSIK